MYCVILDGPVVISPISGNVAAATLPLNRSATNQWQVKENPALMSPNANALDSELPALAPKLRDQERDIKAPCSSPSAHKKNLRLMSPNANVSNNKPPVLAPKLRDQERDSKAPGSSPGSYNKNPQLTSLNANVPNNKPPALAPRLRDQLQATCSNVNENGDDDDDVYNFPRKDLYHGANHQSDETYDTPSRFIDPIATTYDDTYDLPPKSCGTAVENDDIYDVPLPLPTNTANDCRTPCGNGHTSHHGYINTASILTAIATERIVSEMKDMHKVPAESDAADIYDIAVSARTRSFKTSNSWYVLHFYFQYFAKSD